MNLHPLVGTIRASLASLAMFLALSLPIEAHSARVERAAFQSAHFEYLVDESKTGIIPYLSSHFESSYRRLTDYFSYRPEGSIHVLVLDEDDYSNGYAFSAQGWIVILLPPADFDLRGTTAWLPNVISHELAHVITLRKMGVTSRFLGYELMSSIALRREGTVQADASVQWHHTPAWFAEGLAQLGSQVCGHDTTDAIRRMIMGTAAESDDMLSLPEMAAFGWDGRKNEMIYTQGYFLTAWLYREYGRERMNRVLEAMREGSMERAFRKELSKGPQELYSDWSKRLASTAGAGRPAETRAPLVRLPGGIPYVVQSGPVKSADGALAYLSSERNDFGITDLYVRKDGTSRLVDRRAEGPLNLSPDGRILYYTRQSVSWRTGAITRDLHQYDFAGGRSSRLTWNSRVTHAAADGDGKVYALSEDAGRTRLSRLEKGGLASIAEYPVHVKLSALTRGERPGTLLAEVATGRGADIYSVDAADGRLSPILATGADERDPRWDHEGGRLLFSADYDGAYRIHSLRNDSILRWNLDDRPRFAPLAHGGALFTRAYTPLGFVMDSVPVAGVETVFHPRGGVEPNLPFPAPEPADAVRKKWGDDGLRYLGYSGFARLAWAPASNDIFGARDESSPLYGVDDPGGYLRWTAGGGGLWLHPGQESQVILMAGFSGDQGEAMEQGLYLSDALAQYSNRSFGPVLNGIFESQTTRLPVDSPGDEAFAFTLMRFTLSLDWTVNNHLALAGFGTYSGLSLHSGGGLLTDFSGGGALFGGLFQLQAGQPGVNFPNSLFALQSGLGYAPGFGIHETYVNWNSLVLFANTRRLLFYRLSGTSTTFLSEDFATDISGEAALSLDIPSTLRLPFPGTRGAFLTNVLPSLGLGYASMPRQIGTDSRDAFGPRIHASRPAAMGAAAMQAAFANPLETGRTDMLISLALKMVSPLENVVYWNFFYALPISGISRNSYFGINLSF